jgi:hypothetical protein
MTLSRIFGWMLIATAGAACAYMIWTFAGLIVSAPTRDPMPVVIAMFGEVYFLVLAVLLSGIGYIICRVLRI